MKKSIFRPRTVPLALLILCIAAFGLAIPWLGFYQDDWIVIWLSRTFGPRVLIESFAHERPFYAAIYLLTTTLVGDSALAWQIFGLLTRWLSAVSVWWFLSVLWPGKTRQAATAALLFVIYPSFKQQFVSVAFSQNFLLMAAQFFSFGAMLMAQRSPRRSLAWTVLALLSGAFSMFSAEYFFGVEILRPLVLWVSLRRTTPDLRTSLKRTAWLLLPYLGVVLLFLGWRLLIFKFPTYEPKLLTNFLEHPYMTMLELVQTIIQDALDVTLFTWTSTLNFTHRIQYNLGSWLFLWGSVAVSALAAWYYLVNLENSLPQAETASQARSDSGFVIASEAKQSPLAPGDCFSPRSDISDEVLGLQATLLGLASLLLAGWPYWFTGLQVEAEISNDRFTMAFMFGASLLIMGLLETLLKNKNQRAAIVGILVGLAVSMHLQLAGTFRQANEGQANFFRQLVWRVPGLRTDTLLLTDTLRFPYAGSNSLAAPLNWIYASDYNFPQMAYQLIFIPEELGKDLPALEPGLPVRHDQVPLRFTGSTSQAVVFYHEPPACLQILQPGVHDQLPRLPGEVLSALELSNLDQIQTTASGPSRRLEEIFGPQPAQDWCYFFEKADLARQVGDWAKIVKLGDQAFKLPRPDYKYEIEFIPYIEGYANGGQWDKAINLTRRALNSLPTMRPALCQTWQRISIYAAPNSERQAAMQRMNQNLDCAPRLPED